MPASSALELGQRCPHRVGQRGEHAEDLALLLADGLDQLVVGLHHASGSTKSVAPLCERSWTMPRRRLFASARHRQDVAAVADRDVALLEDGVRRGRLKYASSRCTMSRAQIAEARRTRRSAGSASSRTLAVFVERAPEQVGQGLRRGKPAKAAARSGATGRMPRP